MRRNLFAVFFVVFGGLHGWYAGMPEINTVQAEGYTVHTCRTDSECEAVERSLPPLQECLTDSECETIERLQSSESI